MSDSSQLSDTKRRLLELIHGGRANKKMIQFTAPSATKSSAAAWTPRLLSLSEQDVSELRSFLSAILNTPLDATFLSNETLLWKYFRNRPDWSQPRSWAYRDSQGRISAHVGVWPVAFEVDKRRIVQTMTNLDWAAVKDSPGLGAMLRQEVIDPLPVLFGIGGTPQAQSVLAEQGYAKVGSLDGFVRSIRPLKRLRDDWPMQRSQIKEMLQQQAASWKAGFELGSWTIQPLSSFEPLRALLENRYEFGWTACVRAVDLMNYMLACPVNSKAFHLWHKGKPIGYLFMNQNGERVNIVDLWIASTEERLWSDAYAIALRAARTLRHQGFVWVQCSTDLLRRAAARNRFTPRGARPLWIKDKYGLLRNAAPLHIQPLESDRWFL